MAELVIQERLQPSLLDRLTDDEPTSTQESRQKRVMSISNLRTVMLRDLGWLLNATNLGTQLDAESYPLTASSVLNYGKPDMAGLHIRDSNIDRIEEGVRIAILHYEPRILPGTLKVRATVSSAAEGHRTLRFEIQGTLWCQPVPLRLFLKTAVDLETGDVQISNLAF